MNAQNDNKSLRYCGRSFTPKEMNLIRELITSNPTFNRVQLSRLVCDKLGWLRPDGRTKEMSCRVAMLRMHRENLITLPPPQKGNGNSGNRRPILTSASDPKEPISCSAGSLGKLKFQSVSKTSKLTTLWNELIERYHYLGYSPLPGAQIRYLVFGKGHLLAAMGFGAAAWSTAPRDTFIGWSTKQRSTNLHLVVNNARFLIVPWVNSHNLASRILSGVVKQLPNDWEDCYGYRPVLLETFVQQDKFTGTCYRAANWIHVGETKGRGKLDRKKEYALPVKEIFVYPMNKHFRKKLCSLE